MTALNGILLAVFLQAQPTLGLRHIDLRLSLDYETGKLAGTAALTVENTGDAATRTIPFQVGRLMTVSRVTGSAGPLDFQQDIRVYEDFPVYQLNQLQVESSSPLGPGEQRTYTIEYSGTLVPYTETGMQYVRDHIDRGFTILRAEAFAFPQLATVESASTRRVGIERSDFTYGMELTVPSDLTVAVGRPPSGIAEGDSLATWTFEEPDPVPFLNISIAPYRSIEDGAFRVFYFPEDSAGAAGLLAAMRAASSRYAELYGPIEGSRQVHVIEIPSGWGSQASLKAGIIQTADAFRDRGQRAQLYHELVHLWHPRDVDDPAPRWNEGLATFLQVRMAAELDGGPSLAEWVEGRAVAQAARVRRSAGDSVLAMADYGRRGTTGLSYRTGAMMFYALYRTMGGADFDRGLATWFAGYRSTGSTTEQFVATMSQASSVDLTGLFQDWLFTDAWVRKIEAGASVEDMIRGYAR